MQFLNMFMHLFLSSTPYLQILVSPLSLTLILRDTAHQIPKPAGVPGRLPALATHGTNLRVFEPLRMVKDGYKKKEGKSWIARSKKREMSTRQRIQRVGSMDLMYFLSCSKSSAQYLGVCSNFHGIQSWS
jgi:hypothetical protein